jgi:glutaconyl-CoA/methylmalonyl-CoA decarboxylase subunit gamma
MTKKLRITVDGKSYDVLVETLDAPAAAPSAPSAPALPTLGSAPAAPKAAAPAAPAAAPKAAAAPVADSGEGVAVESQVSGVVVSVDVAVGDTVQADQQLFTVEAMKMNTYVTAPQAGKVTFIGVEKGSPVGSGDVMARIG